MREKYCLATAVLVFSALAAGALDVQVGGRLAGGFGFLKGSDWTGHSASSLTQTAPLTFSAGAFADLAVNPWITVQAGAGFSRISNRYIYTTATEVREGRLTGHLLELPFVFQPGFEAGRGRFYAFFGLDLLVLLGDMIRVEQSDVVSIAEPVRPDSRFLLGGTGGLGCSFGLGPGAALVELRYARNITPLFLRSRTGLTGFWLALGYGVPLRRAPARPPGSPASR